MGVSSEFQPKYSVSRRIEIIFSNQPPSFEADDIRKMLLKDNKCIKNMISMGGVSEKRLCELENLRSYQHMYAWIIKMNNIGGECAKEANDQLFNLSLDEYAGFLVFKRKYYEKESGLMLISVED